MACCKLTQGAALMTRNHFPQLYVYFYDFHPSRLLTFSAVPLSSICHLFVIAFGCSRFYDAASPSFSPG